LLRWSQANCSAKCCVDAVQHAPQLLRLRATKTDLPHIDAMRDYGVLIEARATYGDQESVWTP
jgi:hypothetical protein